MQGKCLSCGTEQNLTERLRKGEVCLVCGALLKTALAKLVAQAVGMTVVMSEDFGATSAAVATLPPLADLVRPATAAD